MCVLFKVGVHHGRLNHSMTQVNWGYIGVMEKKMETTIVYWGCIGIMENQMETTVLT